MSHRTREPSAKTKKYSGIRYHTFSTSDNEDDKEIMDINRCSWQRLKSCLNRGRELIFPDGCRGEARGLLSIAWAIILTSFLQFFLQSTSVIMSGHLSTIELDSVALANSLISVLGVHIIGGMSTAFDTFFSQSYGAGNKKSVGVYLQRALILAYLVLLTLYCVHLNVEPLLVAVGQDRIKAMMAGQYIIFLLPGLFFDFTFQTLAKYLQNQERALPPLLCAVIGNIVNVSSQYVSIYVYGASYLASAICQSTSFAIMVILELSFILCSGIYKENWDGWKPREALEDWGMFMRLALPGICLIAFEAWSFELGLLFMGLLGTVQMGAQVILFHLEAWTFMLPFGFSIAVSIRVGQKLGENDTKGASVVYRTAMLIVTVSDVIVTIVFIVFRYQLPKIFTADVEVISVTASAIPIFAISHFLVGFAHVTSGALRGCGHQLVGAVTNFIVYYIIGLPIGVSLALLTPLKVLGLWIGLATATLTETISFVLYLNCRVDWEKEAKKAQIIAAVATKNASHKSRTGSTGSQMHLVSTSAEESHETDYKSVDTEKSRSRQKTTDFRKLLIRRLLTCAIIISLFIASIVANLFVPKTWRPQCMKMNNETLSIQFPVLPFCNETELQ